MKFSVIVLTYNSILNDVLLSINSILLQKEVEYELVVADDGSINSHESQIIEFLEQKNCHNYKFVKTAKNGGTVKNAINGVKNASGEIIKLLGAGDCLYSEYTLLEIGEEMSKDNCCCCFGKMTSYFQDKSRELKIGSFCYPRDIKAYKGTNKNKLVFRNLIRYEDWISGASMFFNKNYLLSYLKNMDGVVKYCEDLISAELVLNKIYFKYVDLPVVWYKVGDGISTQKNVELEKKMELDHKRYWNYLEKRYDNSYLKKCNQQRRVKKEKSKLCYYLLNPGKILFEIKVRLQCIERKRQDVNNYDFNKFREMYKNIYMY